MDMITTMNNHKATIMARQTMIIVTTVVRDR
jgi:hypothetical protein